MRGPRVFWILVVAFISASVGIYLYADGFYRGSKGNCLDKAVRDIHLAKGLEVMLVRRECGMLYGGPYTVVKLKSTTFPYSLRGPTSIIEIEDDQGSISPSVSMDHQTVVVEVPGYAKYIASANIFGMKVVVRPFAAH